MSRFTFLLIIAILCSENSVQGYIYRGEANVINGYCELEELGFGKVAVGENGYNNARCEKVMCNEGGFVVHGCGTVMYDRENCELVPGSGKYPKCCPQVRCKENS